MLAQRLNVLGGASVRRSLRAWRHSGLLVGVLAGTLGLLAAWAYPLPPAQESAACSGAAEVALTQLLRLLQRMPVASLFNGFNVVLILLAFATFGRLLHLVGGSALLALAGTVAVVWSPAGPATLAPAIGVAALGATSWALVTMLPKDRGAARDPAATAAALIGACAVLALLLPAFVLPLTALTAMYLWHERQRIGRSTASIGALAWSAVTVGAILSATYSAPPGLSPSASAAAGLACMVPRVSAAAVAAWPAVLETMLSSVGPLPFALASAGVAASLWRADYRLLMTLAGGATAAMIAGGGQASGSSDLLMPLVVAFWCLVAMGMRAVIDWSPGGGTRTVLGALLIALVPLLQLAHRQAPTAPAHTPSTPVARLSANGFWYLVRALPDGAIVREDRTTDALFRAVAPRLRRAGRALRVIPADADGVRAAMRSGPVYALPQRQADLRNLGFVFRANRTPDGVAEVVESRPCVELTRTWQVVTEATRTTRFALVTDGPAVRGPVVILLGSEQPPDAWPLYWPARTTRGFRSQTYNLERDPTVGDRLLMDGVPAGTVVDSPHVQRLVLWRTPDAPLMLPVALRHRPTAALASLAPEAEVSGLRLCPVADGP